MPGAPATHDQRLLTRGFVALSAATLAFFVAAGIVLPVAPTFAKEALGADEAGVGVAIASFSIASLLLRPVIGWSTDRFGRRPLLIGGALLNVAALAVHVVATDLAMFIVGRGLLGAAEGFAFVAAIAAGADLAPEERRGEALTFLSLSLYLGLAIGPPIGELLLGPTGDAYVTVWAAAAVVSLVAAVLAWLVPESAPASAPARPASEPPVGSRRSRLLLFHPAGVFPGVVVLLGLWGMAGYLTFVPLHARELGMGGAGAPLVLYAGVVIGLRLIGRRWPDRYGAVRVSGTALLVTALGLGVIAASPTETGLLAGTALFAAGVAFTMPALLSFAVGRAPSEERGRVTATVTVFLDITFGVAPVMLGMIAARSGYGPAFAVCGAFALLAAGLLALRRGTLGPQARPAAAT